MNFKKWTVYSHEKNRENTQKFKSVNIKYIKPSYLKFYFSGLWQLKSEYDWNNLEGNKPEQAIVFPLEQKEFFKNVKKCLKIFI